MSITDLTTRATDAITLDDIAREAGLSLASLKQYRQAEGNKGRRNPSPEAEAAIYRAIAKLAKEQAAYFTKIAQRAEKGA
jgi:hypothetical protein